MENSIRVGKRQIIEIEVNDNGDTIKIDPNDKRFTLSLTEFIKIVKGIIAETNKANEDLMKKINDAPEEALLEAVEFEATQSKKVAEAINNVFGAETCDKVFGKECIPSLDMILDFYQQITPFIQKAVNQRNQTINKRYAPKVGGSV